MVRRRRVPAGRPRTFSVRRPPYLSEHMFPASRIPRPLLRALDVAMEFATLGEVRLDPGWEELAWLDDEGLRSEWFRDATPPAPGSQLPRARAAFTPATPA